MKVLIRRFTKKDERGYSRSYGVFSCVDCSIEFESRIERIDVMTGRCKSCADIKGGEKRRTHGFNNSNSRLHVTWANMKRRCLNPTEREKRNYGNNIVVCSEWMNFEPFMEWALSNGYAENLTIDRIEGDRGYSPNNCRFVGYGVQSANRKITDKNKSGYIGVSVCGKKWLASVQWNGKQNRLGRFFDKVEAAVARDKYIVDNKLPHTLNFSIDELNSFL